MHVLWPLSIWSHTCSDSVIKAWVWEIRFFTYLFVIKTINLLWHGKLTNFCTVICLMRWQTHSWLFRNKKTSPSHPLWGRGKKKKKSFSMTVYSIFNSQPDFLSRKQRSERSASVSMVRSDVTEALLSWYWWITESQSPLEGVGVGRADPSTAQTAAPGQPFPHHTTAPEHILLCPS